MATIRGARLFDGEVVSTFSQPAVVLDGRRISAVAEGVGLSDEEVLDLGDVTLMPGLVDAHVHLVFDASEDPVGHLAERDDQEVLDQARSAARRALAAGVTTLRDLGDRNYLSLVLRDEVVVDPTARPHLLVAGPPVTMPSGHCWFLGGEAEGLDGVREAVRERARRGVDVVKVMVTGGWLTQPGSEHVSQYGVSELQAIVDEAHGLGLPVTGHAEGLQGIKDAVAAGLDGIEHCFFLTEDGLDADPDVIARLAEAGTFVSLTAAGTGDPDQNAPGERIGAVLPELIAAVRSMHEAGVRLVQSTDAGVGPAQPHDALPYGVPVLGMIGVTGAQALRMVTSLPADACAVGHRKGRLAPGYDADLLAVVGDPVADPRALRQVAAVFRAGARVT